MSATRLLALLDRLEFAIVHGSQPPALDTVRCLYISYNGLQTALVQSQVLPYLRGLAQMGAKFVLLTFEPSNDAPADGTLVDQLRADGIVWRRLQYHQTPTLPATAFDIATGIALGTLLAVRFRLNLVHARGYPPAMMARGIKMARGLPFVFDMRGLMADEYVDTGRWTRTSLSYRATKIAERHLLEQADSIVVLTDRIRQVLWPNGTRHGLATIPCSVDLRSFTRRMQPDDTLAAALGLQGRRVLVYAGSVGTWYLLDSMLRFAAFMHARDPRWHLLLLNQNEHGLITRRLGELLIDPSFITVRAVPPPDMPRYLALAEASLCFVNPSFSKLASSPTKVGEYLAMGLPIVARAGVGDLDELLMRQAVGALVHGETIGDFSAAANALDALLADVATPDRCRRVAETELSLTRAIQAYANVYRGIQVSMASRS